ncbi:MAG: MFS transporter [Verrucomicrobia bacterium]|nr:MFS transporter [Verrucomicrobiota bacterium]
MNLQTSLSYRLPFALGIAHGISDGAAGLLLGSLATNSSATQTTLLVLIYNALAFGSQPLIGYFADSLRSPRIFASGGMVLLAASLVTRGLGFGEVAVLVAGVGSAAFHVGAGALTLRSCNGRSDAAGLFAAPGVIGLAMGGALAVSGHYLYLPFFVSLLAFVFLIQAWPLPPRQTSVSKPIKEPIFESHDWIMIGLLTAVALRSLLWTSFQFASAGQITALVALGVAAGTGKIVGGFAAERLGYRRWTMLSLLIAAPLLAFAGKKLALLLPGVALLQSSIPCSIAAMARLLPARPATAAGLVLGLAVALGGLPTLLAIPPALTPAVALVIILIAAVGFWFTTEPKGRAISNR